MPQQLLILVAVLAGATAAWFLLQAHAGRVRTVRDVGPRAGAAAEALLALVPPADVPTFVLVSSATCSTCPQARRVLESVTAAEPVGLVELDADEHPDVVRSLGILRTPTVLLLDVDRAVRTRTSGPLSAGQARAALAGLATLPGSPDPTRI
ncbi:thioredoxin family protein [Actinotalea subterranea]|uniref:thioredoxin family protein n=1 Tax=Actinotalea subterranea TaxID=2607497 RepID=UPI0011ED85CC|nr:thioredoxin family protein [Actinotalea subterranea]